MNNILSNLFFQAENASSVKAPPPYTIVIDTSRSDGYLSVDHITKSVYNKFMEDYRKFSQADDITVSITSSGGDIFYILLIANVINKHKGTVTARIDKFCTGGAFLIALACDNILMAEYACIGYLHFYSSILPLEGFKNFWNKACPYDLLNDRVKSYVTDAYSVLSRKCSNVETEIRKILNKNYSTESIEKIINYLYLNPFKMEPIFKEDVPDYLNISFDDDDDDDLDEDGDIVINKNVPNSNVDVD